MMEILTGDDVTRIMARANDTLGKHERDDDRPQPHIFQTCRDLTGREVKNYSLCRGILHLADKTMRHKGYVESAKAPRDRNDPPLQLPDWTPTCLEEEISASLAAEGVRSNFGGLLVPTRLRASGLDTKTDAAGAYTRATEVRELIDALAQQSRVISLGGQLLSNLRSNVAFPVENTPGSATWVSENPGSDASANDPSFGQLSTHPKMLTAGTSFSRTLLAQSSPSIENYVRRRIAGSHSRAIDAAAIAGTGVSNEPLGLVYNPDRGSVTMGAAVPTLAKLSEMEKTVALAGADAPSNAWLTTPGLRDVLRRTQKFTGSSSTLWSDNNEVLGYTGAVSTAVPINSAQHSIFFGDWGSVLILEFGVFELVVDPYQLKKQGMIEVQSYQIADILIVRQAALCGATDATLS